MQTATRQMFAILLAGLQLFPLLSGAVNTQSTIQYQGWIYPDNCEGQNFITNTRVPTIKIQYMLITNGQVLILTPRDYGCDTYTPEHAAFVKSRSDEQYVTVAGSSVVEMRKIWSDATQISNTVSTMVNFIKQIGFTGIDIDFEDYWSWSTTDYANYKLFINTLGESLRANRLKLAICTPYLSGPYSLPYWNYNDFNALAVDYIVVMAYGNQYDIGAGNAAAPNAWLKNAITYIQTYITDKNRIVIGIAGDCYSGVTGSKTSIEESWDKIATPANGFSSSIPRDPNSYEFLWTFGGKSFSCIDQAGMDMRLELLLSNGVKGVSVWFLGGGAWFSRLVGTAPVAEWNTCKAGIDTCSTSGNQCCFGNSVDFLAGKTTCRPSANCYSLVADGNPCSPASDVCASSTSKCCFASGSAMSLGGNTCVANGNCYTPVSQWSTCLATDVCSTNNICCFGSADDHTAGKKTCRPSVNCYNPPQTSTTTTSTKPVASTTTKPKPPMPVLPDPNYQGGYKWAARIFAPLADVSLSATDMLGMSSKVGSARYVVGFITASPKNQPAWNGVDLISSLKHLPIIQSIRLFGGEFICSFGGGGGGIELATVLTTGRALQIAYQNVIDAYGATWIDFFLDAKGTANTAAIDLRNQVLRAMQVSNPNLRISYTLPVTPKGLDANAQYVLQSAVNAGVRVDVVILQTYNYGSSAAPNAATASGTYAIQAATFTYSQFSSIGLGATTTIGLIPYIGNGVISGEVFKTSDASQIVTWAKTVSWVSLISFHSIARDNQAASGITQKTYDFGRQFVQFEN